jgi:hypothetical protein
MFKALIVIFNRRQSVGQAVMLEEQAYVLLFIAFAFRQECGIFRIIALIGIGE